LIEDVGTTGGAAVRAAKVLREAGAGKVTILLVVDRQEGARKAFEEAGFEYRVLFTRESLGIGAD
jgi:orotate phosphoribosyltransferase